MPLFRRSDGTVVSGLSLVRRIIPFLMRGRNESVVYYEQMLDLTKALPFIERWNATATQKITVFHLIMAAAGKGLIARPGLNRFVSGGRIYQRKGAWISFAAKQRFADSAALVTVKIEMKKGEALAQTIERIHGAVGEGRSDKQRPVDKELKLLFMVPHFVLGWLVGIMRLLDRWNLMPASLIANDPMYTSLFVANLGSVGIDRATHHLYEHGTCSLFCAIGVTKKIVAVDAAGAPVVKDTVSLRFAFDERINDGYYCAASLDVLRRYVEDPELFLTEPDPGEERSPRVRASAI
ncbi:MAG: 2-oxo acid dehydrogenase subunit E2 [Deltaproteobacteria bacterium]|nr:2-oxo acid dehydrogenase subunit E2 [Deltaproteobacteria bacterium]